MSDSYYKLPDTLAQDIEQYAEDVERTMRGDLEPGVFKAKRVPRGIYEQRQDGTFMVRVRVAGGVLSRNQAHVLGELSTNFGNGLIHVTTRQDIQLHDIQIADTPEIMRRLRQVGLTSKGGGGNTVRNITACPLAGICAHESFDVTPFACAVTEFLIAQEGSYNLPRKYKIAFSGCGSDCALGQVADLGFTACVRDGKPGFRVFAGGGMGSHSRVADLLIEWLPAHDAVRVAEAVRRLFDKHGDRSNKHRARLRYVFERLGVDAFRKEFEQQLAAISGDEVPQPANIAAVVSETSAAGPPEQLEMAGIKVFPQRQAELVAMPLHLPLGYLPADQFVQLADIAADNSEENGLRTTRAQNLLIRSVPEASVATVARQIRETIATDILARPPLERFIVCAGAATCRLGLCLSQSAAIACDQAMTAGGVSAETMSAMEVCLNGCPNACGHQPIGALGLSGAAQRHEGRLVPTYRISLGGRCDGGGARFGTFVGEVPARALAGCMVELATDFQQNRNGGEQFSAYYDRIGAKHFHDIVSKYSPIPAYADAPEFYRDLGADVDFSLAGRGAGECGTGVFEVIQDDLKAARRTADPLQKLIHTARALLITRGTDTRDPDQALRAFEQQFVDTGLVAPDFRNLLVRGRGAIAGLAGTLEGQEECLAQLLERVELLYSTLDASLKFHPPETEPGAASVQQTVGAPGSAPAAPDAGDAGGVQHLDLSGVACPMNFVKAKLRLESLGVGDRLDLVLDDGDPIRNVPESFRNEGQEVVSTERLDNGQWKAVIQKKR